MKFIINITTFWKLFYFYYFKQAFFTFLMFILVTFFANLFYIFFIKILFSQSFCYFLYSVLFIIITYDYELFI